MSLGANKQALMGAAGAAGGGDFYDYQITKSARFDGSASYLNKTWGAEPSSTTQKTISVWLKKCSTGDVNPQMIITSIGNTGSYYFNNDDAIADNFAYYMGGGGVNGYTTDRRFRDPNAWFHFVAILNSAESNDYDRLKVYFNGELYPLNNGDWTFNAGYPNTNIPTLGKNGVANYISRYGSATRYFNGYMADFIQIDGAAAISDFGETKNGVWIPKDPSGLTFGTNGFWLKFTNSSDFGEDFSGNNNDWTANSMGTDHISLDTPTFSATDGNGGNFATIGGLEKNTGGFTFSEGNLKYAINTNQRGFIFSQGVPDSGKYYWEVRVTAFGGSQDDVYPGVCVPDIMRSNLTGSRGGANVSGAGGYTVNLYNGAAVLDGVFQSNDAIGNKRAVPQTVGIAIDRDNNTLKWTYDGSTYSSTYAIPSSGVLAPFLGSGGGSNMASGVFNFGADSTFAGLVSAGGNADENGFGDFSLAVPSGYLALCAGNLPVANEVDPAQTDNFPQKLFNPLIWTGDGNTSRAITGLGFQPDWVWFKSRSSAFSNRLYDTSRGISGTGGKRLFSNTDAAEVDQTSGQDISAVGTDGFTLGASSANYTNDTNSGGLQVGWFWRANGGTETTNDVGTQTSYTQTDPSGAFSITRYAGTGSSMTVGHGLSVEPKITIIKDRDAVVDWVVYTKVVDGSLDFFILNTDTASADSGFTGPNSTIWNFDGSSGYSNTAGRNYIMYNFANIEGYCKVGTYVGNADDDGTFLYTGFKPAFFMCKPIVTGNWRIQDNKRTPVNVANKTLFPNRSDATLSNDSNDIDILSNGIKMRASDSDYNQATTFIYLAMAHNPFKYATAR